MVSKTIVEERQILTAAPTSCEYDHRVAVIYTCLELLKIICLARVGADKVVQSINNGSCTALSYLHRYCTVHCPAKLPRTTTSNRKGSKRDTVLSEHLLLIENLLFELDVCYCVVNKSRQTIEGDAL